MKTHLKPQGAHRHAPSAAEVAAAAEKDLQCSGTLQTARRQSRGSWEWDSRLPDYRPLPGTKRGSH